MIKKELSRPRAYMELCLNRDTQSLLANWHVHHPGDLYWNQATNRLQVEIGLVPPDAMPWVPRLDQLCDIAERYHGKSWPHVVRACFSWAAHHEKNVSLLAGIQEELWLRYVISLVSGKASQPDRRNLLSATAKTETA